MCVVLLADADPEECDRLTRVLEQAGHTVRAYTNGLGAWDAIRSQPDILVLNIAFPKGQPHGLAIAARARSTRPRTRVIFLSRPFEPANQFLEDECVLQKPYESAALLALVEASEAHDDAGALASAAYLPAVG